MTCDKCRNCPDVKYKHCPAPNIITNGKFCCEKELTQENTNAVCDHCGKKLVLGHFAYEPNWKEFWCEECLRELLAEFEEKEREQE